jgi:hypothetical protein
MRSEVTAMQASYDCPDCNRIHDEPAVASLGFRVRCSSCEFERARTERVPPIDLPAAA